MLQFNSALLAIAGGFVGTYAPYQAIHIAPHNNGVLVASTDQGRAAFIGYDPRGTADETYDLLPDSKLLTACAGIKSAERDVTIDDGIARVTTYRKTAANEIKEFPALRSSAAFPSLQPVLRACIDRWGKAPALATTAGRYASPLLINAIKSIGGFHDSIVLSAFDGGPLRIQCDGLDMLILIMPQTAEPIPVLPDWICSYAGTSSPATSPAQAQSPA